MQKMSTFSSIAPSLAVLTAYLLVSYSPLHYYALQIFSLGIIAFLVLKKIKKTKILDFSSQDNILETALVAFSVLFLIGSTGISHSPFFAVSFVVLFFVIFSTDWFKATITITSLVLFFLALEPHIGLPEIEALINIPLIGLLLFFAKKQYDQSKLTSELLKTEAKALDKTNLQEETLELFTKNFLRPKLHFISALLNEMNVDHEVIHQINLTLTEVDKIMGKVTEVDLEITELGNKSSPNSTEKTTEIEKG